MDVFENIFIKPPSVPYLGHVKEVDNKVERMLTVKWEMRSASLKPVQERFLGKMAYFLKKNDDASIVITPMEYTNKEKEYVLFFEAKKKYYLLNHASQGSLTERDSIVIDKMSVKDSLFVRYLNTHVPVHDSLLFTIQDKCRFFLANSAVSIAYTHLLRERKDVILNYFKEKGVQDRVKIEPNITLIPHDGFSYFKIDYKGELPYDLIKAYNEMNDLDNRSPRGKYKDERRKDGGALPEL